MLRSRRVVVTGIGMLTPVGNNVEESWQSILNGKSGVTKCDLFENSNFNSRIYAGIKNLPTDKLDPKDIRRLDEFIQYGLIAAEQAIQDANLLNVDEELAEKIGVIVGSGIGGLSSIQQSNDILAKSGPRRVSPFFIPGAIINMVAGMIAIKHGFKGGPNMSIVSACTTGAHNIGEAFRSIMYGDADIIIAGGTEKASTNLGIAGFSSAKALSSRNDEPEKASRPWDKDRDGFVLGDGAGILVLEEYEHAKKRGVKIYAEVLGYGTSCDAYHITAMPENGTGAMACMRKAMHDAQLPITAIDHINAHATSTPLGDMVELRAIKGFFGDHVYKVSMSATKSMTGHLLGATGAVEAIFSILSINNNIAPPTINLDNPDDECDVNLVPHTAQEQKIQYVMSNSFGFGGTNASLIFSKVK